MSQQEEVLNILKRPMTPPSPPSPKKESRLKLLAELFLDPLVRAGLQFQFAATGRLPKEDVFGRSVQAVPTRSIEEFLEAAEPNIFGGAFFGTRPSPGFFAPIGAPRRFPTLPMEAPQIPEVGPVFPPKAVPTRPPTFPSPETPPFFTPREPMAPVMPPSEAPSVPFRMPKPGEAAPIRPSTPPPFFKEPTLPGIRGAADIPPLQQKVMRASENLKQATRKVQELNEQTKMALEEAETIKETGTLKPETRVEFREGFPKPETFRFRVSEKQVRETGATIIQTAREIERLSHEMRAIADPVSQQTAQTLHAMMQQAVKEANRTVARWRKQRFALGRSVRAFNLPFSDDLLMTLKEAGVLVEGLQRARERLPIYTNILRSLKQWTSLTDAQKGQFAKDVVDAFRFNLFAVTSFTLDLVSNITEIGAQVAGGISRDLIHLVKGHPTFPSFQGLTRSVRARLTNIGNPLAPYFEEALELTIGGEQIRGRFRGVPGLFTTRETLGSKIVDYAVGTPLYLKGATDTAAKRLMTVSTLWREAIERADAQGLRGLERRRFYQEFLNNIPEDVAERAIANGNKAGFNRALSRFEERVAGSKVFQLLGDAFARWPFQFTRTFAEWLGYNKPLFERALAGKVSAEELAEYFGKTATGWGGVWLIDHLYDRTDFNSMEYVHPDGNRTRLSNREPLPTALWLLAVIKGDAERASGALRFASVPGGRLLSGEGGILGSLITTVTKALQTSDVNPEGVKRELTNFVNRAIPGQAVLSTIKTVFDPTLREGIGANLPGVSRLLPPAISRTTGEPLKPRQRLFGYEFPAVLGVPIPGATRVIDPVHALLARHGLLVYRGLRQPIAGVPAGEAPRKLVREWEASFGAYRQAIFAPLIAQFEEIDPEVARKQILRLDSMAARLATLEVTAAHGKLPLKPPRQPTLRERRGPRVLEEQESVLKILRGVMEEAQP